MALLHSGYMTVKVSTIRYRNARRTTMGYPTGVDVSVKFTPSTHWRRLLIEWGVIHHVWTNKPHHIYAHLYVLCVIRNGGKVVRVFPPRWS